MALYQYIIAGGLIFDIFGVILLAYFEPETFNIVFESTPEKKYSKPWVKTLSIVLIVLGFILQLLGNLLA